MPHPHPGLGPFRVECGFQPCRYSNCRFFCSFSVVNIKIDCISLVLFYYVVYLCSLHHAFCFICPEIVTTCKMTLYVGLLDHFCNLVCKATRPKGRLQNSLLPCCMPLSCKHSSKCLWPFSKLVIDSEVRAWLLCVSRREHRCCSWVMMWCLFFFTTRFTFGWRCATILFLQDSFTALGRRFPCILLQYCWNSSHHWGHNYFIGACTQSIA